MRVQLQNTFFYPSLGGIENYLYFISKSLIGLDHIPTVFCSQNSPKLSEYDSYEKINVIRHPYYHFSRAPLSLINPTYFTYGLKKYIKKMDNDTDVIWSRHFHYAYASGKILNDKVPLIFIQAAVANNLSKIGRSTSGVISRNAAQVLYLQNYFYEKKAMQFSRKIVTLSEIRKREICNYYSMSSEKFEVIPPGIDINVFKPRVKDCDLLKECNISESDLVLLTVGRLSHEKNLGMLIDAVSKIQDGNVKLVVVGDGSEKESLMKLCREKEIAHKVIFVGSRKDVHRFYNLADIFIHTSIYEGFGHVFLEAMASGLPCIGLRSDFPRVIVASDEIILDNKTGFLVDPYSVDDLRDKIQILLNDDEMRRRFGWEARLTCETKYSWDSCAKSLLTLSESLI